MKEHSKILLFDIETFPTLGYFWSHPWETSIISIKEDWYMLSFAYKWLGEKTVHVCSLPDFKTYKKDKKDDKELCKMLWKLLDEAEVICGHNALSFDCKKANARFIAHEFLTPKPYKIIDTKIEAKKYFNFTSNKLDDLGQYLNLGKKIQTGGFDLWKKCSEGDEQAWQLMEKYNRQDVILLEKIYMKMQGWMTTHPNMNLINDTTDGCPNCGSKDLHKRGFATTRVAKFQRWQCQKCGAWSRSPLKGGIVR